MQKQSMQVFEVDRYGRTAEQLKAEVRQDKHYFHHKEEIFDSLPNSVEPY